MAAPLKLDDFIEKLMCANPAPVSSTEAQWLCLKIRPLLLAEPSLLVISGPINIVGDIHGQIHDLVQIIHTVGLPPYAKWLFLGDYVDRGKNSVEVICLLFALKMKFPSQIYLIRGNHESRDMTEIFGFADECRQKLNISIWSLFCATFDALPIAAVVNFRILCVHGGISPDLASIKQIADISRPCDIPQSGFVTDLMWSDPLAETREYADSIRGSTVTWGLEPAKRFMKANKLTMIVRGHQVAFQGFEFPFFPNKSVVTVFSASNYDPAIKNKAGYMIVDKEGKVSFKSLTPSLSMSMPIPKRKVNSARSSSNNLTMKTNKAGKPSNESTRTSLNPADMTAPGLGDSMPGNIQNKANINISVNSGTKSGNTNAGKIGITINNGPRSNNGPNSPSNIGARPRRTSDTPRSHPRAGSMSICSPPSGVPTMVPPGGYCSIPSPPRKRALRTQSQLSKIPRARRATLS
ncbi:protein phosphatase-2B [Tritrichomonas foetus]|uniref:Serine/threonine-protein phosphatase n=1 Tax=Tritrichomonas foetus TaxID=1144522 RepID=A0A1J4K8E4_9EUKA|nr:protein phosphatase-2B [Tritrichomonas foetus]|eukprot:OHT07769.1 protein phosphatase-2B [Tritrichomonas foetus]